MIRSMLAVYPLANMMPHLQNILASLMKTHGLGQVVVLEESGDHQKQDKHQFIAREGIQVQS